MKKIKYKLKIETAEWHSWTQQELKKNDWEPKYDFICCDAGIPTFLYGRRDYLDLVDKFTSLVKKEGVVMFRAHVHEPNIYNEPPGSIKSLLDLLHITMDSEIPAKDKHMIKERAIREYCSTWIRDNSSGILNYSSYYERMMNRDLSQRDFQLLGRPLAELGHLATYVPEPSDFVGPLINRGFGITYEDPTKLHSPFCIGKRV